MHKCFPICSPYSMVRRWLGSYMQCCEVVFMVQSIIMDTFLLAFFPSLFFLYFYLKSQAKNMSPYAPSLSTYFPVSELLGNESYHHQLNGLCTVWNFLRVTELLFSPFLTLRNMHISVNTICSRDFLLLILLGLFWSMTVLRWWWVNEHDLWISAFSVLGGKGWTSSTGAGKQFLQLVDLGIVWPSDVKCRPFHMLKSSWHVLIILFTRTSAWYPLIPPVTTHVAAWWPVEMAILAL